MAADADFSTYVAARWPTLVRAAVLLGCSPHEAEDLAQTALTKCFIKWARVAEAADTDAYVYRVLVNCYTDSRRRRWWGERPVAEPPEPAQAADDTAAVDAADAVHRALSRLSGANRAVVVLRFYANLSEKQMADVLGIAPAR